MSGDVALTGPDFTQVGGVPLSEIPDGGMLRGHAFGKPVLVARRGQELFAVEATCTHYGASLADGVMVGDTVRCPWHHACFDLRSGVPVKAPALRPLARFAIERAGDRVRVTKESVPGDSPRAAVDRSTLNARIVIIGAGAAGDAAADMLRRQGHSGTIVVIGEDPAPPCDRPNLSKDYLAGNAPEEWIPLRAPDFYSEQHIEVRLGQRVAKIDRRQRQVMLQDGTAFGYDKLLLATGAAPVRLPDAVTSGAHIRYLRTLADSRDIIAAAESARRAVVIGASFIGLEVAASLRARKLEVHVVAPDAVPLERVMGRGIGDFIRRKHESQGVVFHLGRTAKQIDASGAVLDDGQRIAADLVVAGIGVRPNVSLAEDAGLGVERGVLVDEQLATSDPNIYAAGDIARYPDARFGGRLRVEHWVVAQRQGQAAAINMLGARQRFTDVPFFWSAHYDATINYVGHAERWDDLQLDGSIDAMDATVRFRSNGRTLAAATIGRDRASLDEELALEHSNMRTS